MTGMPVWKMYSWSRYSFEFCYSRRYREGEYPVCLWKIRLK